MNLTCSLKILKVVAITLLIISVVDNIKVSEIMKSSCSFAIWNTMMGTSLLSLPWGIQQVGD